jgi:hypothetical protein
MKIRCVKGETEFELFEKRMLRIIFGHKREEAKER